MKIGDIVKVKRGMMVVIDNERTCISAEDRFVVIDTIERNVVLKYVALGRLDKFAHGVEFLLGKSSIEVVNDAEEAKLKRSLGKITLNEGKGKMPKGTIVKIGVDELADAREWARSNGYDIELNSDECFTVNLETTKTVYIKSNERKGLVRLPKRFLVEVAPEQIKLSKQDVLALIDIAIDTGDKEWFNELHSKLSTLD